jgi:hypothetical protein
MSVSPPLQQLEATEAGVKLPRTWGNLNRNAIALVGACRTFGIRQAIT